MLNFLGVYSGIDLIIVLMAYTLAVLFAIVLHELAHALMAQRCGDDTARLAGRLTLNPLKHLDVVGTICLLFVGFGWAKPVPVNINNFKERKKGLFLVSIAGVVTNLAIAFFAVALWIGVFYLAGALASVLHTNKFLYYLIMFLDVFLQYLAIINISLMIFNLFPVFPLDGFNLLTSLSNNSAKLLYHMQKYALLYSILLIVICHKFLSPAVDWVFSRFLYFWLSVI